MSDIEAKPELPLEDLTKEKSLYEIYKVHIKFTERNRFNVRCLQLLCFLVGLHCLFTEETVAQVASDVRSLADTGVNFAASILGFLLAGFTIFATMSKPELMVRMARWRYRGKDVSYLKVRYAALIQVFITYLCFAAYGLIIKGIGISHGAVARLSRLLESSLPNTRDVVVRLAYFMTVLAIGYLLIQLKSFVFNVYRVVMEGVRVDVDEAIFAEENAEAETVRKGLAVPVVEPAVQPVVDQARVEGKS